MARNIFHRSGRRGCLTDRSATEFLRRNRERATCAARTPTEQILLLPEGVTAEHIALAQMEVRKARQYDLDLVNDFKMLAPGAEAEEVEEKQKPKPH
jgi:hypothetical protein